MVLMFICTIGAATRLVAGASSTSPFFHQLPKVVQLFSPTFDSHLPFDTEHLSNRRGWGSSGDRDRD
jgi:hypothetical protein